MKKILYYLFVFITYGADCLAQSANLKAALNQVNQTLKDYAIGTKDFEPLFFGMAERAYYTYKRLSIDYPNIVLSYKIEYPSGTATFVHEGVYKVLIPVNSIISYPAIIKGIMGNSMEYNLGVSIYNEDGINKNKNGISTLLTNYVIYADSELTIKKFCKELRNLQQTIQMEGFSGKLETTKSYKENPIRKYTKVAPNTSNENNKSKSSINSNKEKETGRYVAKAKAAQTKWFTINLPKGATISAQSDDIAIYAEIKNTASTQILIEALPFKASLQDAYKLIGRKYPVLFSRQGMPERFNYSRVKGLKAGIGDNKIKGEAFCFHKDGYTVYICSYGERSVYKSISEIVNSISFTVPPYNEKQMGEMLTLLKKALPYQVKSALSKMMPNGYACKDVVLNIGNGYCQFKCTLMGDFSYPHFPNEVSRSNPKAKLLSKAIKNPSIETIDAPLLSTAYLLGAKLSFSFVKPDGKQIKSDR